jgi:hypothetical protein
VITFEKGKINDAAGGFEKRRRDLSKEKIFFFSFTPKNQASMRSVISSLS